MSEWTVEGKGFQNNEIQLLFSIICIYPFISSVANWVPSTMSVYHNKQDNVHDSKEFTVEQGKQTS